MKHGFSRRDFMLKGTVGLGAAVAFELGGVGNTGQHRVLEALASETPKEMTMPHVSIKLWPGRSEEDKKRLADTIVENLVDITGCSEDSVSVAIEDVPSGEWKEKVYEPEIRAREEFLYKKPGYSM